MMVEVIFDGTSLVGEALAVLLQFLTESAVFSSILLEMKCLQSHYSVNSLLGSSSVCCLQPKVLDLIFACCYERWSLCELQVLYPLLIDVRCFSQMFPPHD